MFRLQLEELSVRIKGLDLVGNKFHREHVIILTDLEAAFRDGERSRFCGRARFLNLSLYRRSGEGANVPLAAGHVLADLKFIIFLRLQKVIHLQVVIAFKETRRLWLATCLIDIRFLIALVEKESRQWGNLLFAEVGRLGVRHRLQRYDTVVDRMLRRQLEQRGDADFILGLSSPFDALVHL